VKNLVELTENSNGRGLKKLGCRNTQSLKYTGSKLPLLKKGMGLEFRHQHSINGLPASTGSCFVAIQAVQIVV
jgi:hypothetical protein